MHSRLRITHRRLTLAVCISCVASYIGPTAARAHPRYVAKAIWGPGIQRGTSHFPVYRDLRVGIYQDRLFWPAIAASRPGRPTSPEDPAYVWPKEVDQAVAEALRYHMRVALQIIGAPPWANGGKPWNWAPNPQDYANFATAAARRYPSVHLWMIWGEPSRGHNFQPFLPAKRRSGPLGPHERSAPHRYARILDAAYGALKAVSRSNVVIGGMTYTTGEISPQQWIENMRLPNGRPPRLDMYGHNPFSYRDPSLANPPSPEHKMDFSDLGRLAKVVDRFLGRPGNRRPKLFLSEWSIATAPDSEFNFYVDPPVQARWIADGLHVARQLSSVYAVGWIHLYDEPPITRGGLLWADGEKKPGYFAWRNG